MSSYFLAPAAVKLRSEVDDLFPRRDKRSDGWIGDPSHAARKSEHNPCWTCSGRNYGIVLALDIDIDDNDPTQDLRKMLIEELTGDPRVWYSISNGIIRSRTYGWAPRRYTGANGHFAHLHVSFRIDNAWDTRTFFEEKKPSRVKPYTLDISKLQGEFLRVVVEKKTPRQSVDVRRFQRLFNARMGGTDLKLDGMVGSHTLNAAGAMEKKYGGTGRPRVPDQTLLLRANQGMFKLVA